MKIFVFGLLLFLGSSDLHTYSKSRFNPKKDLLLAQFDCKTDVDDIHAAAAFYTLINYPDYSSVTYHVVAGTYGIQEGLYVPANDLFQLAFGTNWSDAHTDSHLALQRVLKLSIATLEDGGDIWIAEAGQSDFSARLVRTIQAIYPKLHTEKRIHLVQHSEWNESVTSANDLNFVKEHTDYQKIADGNVEGNGTAGFRNPRFKLAESDLKSEKLRNVWRMAIGIANNYNGKEGRYTNMAVSSGGLDFSDLSEVCNILGISDVKNVNDFFRNFGY